ncbi:MAG TPA: ATP-binding protein [Pyrinomonadaceae bacterium]
MSDGNQQPVEHGSVRVSLSALLKILGERMYSSDVVFIRENVQNAVDAVRIRSAREGANADELKIELRISPDLIEVEDWGIGMTATDLKQYYWNVGHTSKDTPEAQYAGCIGQFGIGGFANFGVCREVHVFTAAVNGQEIHSVLKKLDLESDKGDFPIERATLLGHTGTLIRCHPDKKEFDVDAILRYLKKYVEFLPELILVNKQILSRKRFLRHNSKEESVTPIAFEREEVKVVGSIFEFKNKRVKFRLDKVYLNNDWHQVHGEVEFGVKPLLIYKHKFLIADFHKYDGRRYITGKLDLPFVQPLANRESFDETTYMIILKLHDCLVDVLTMYISDRADLVNEHRGTPFMERIFDDENVDLIGKLKVSLIDSSRTTLEDLKLKSKEEGQSIYYSSGDTNSQARAFQAAGSIVVTTADLDPETRWSVEKFLVEFCEAQAVPEVYIKKQFYPHELKKDSAFVLEVIQQHLKAKGCRQIEAYACQLEPRDSMPFLMDEERRKLYVNLSHNLIMKLTSFTDSVHLDAIIDNLLLEKLGSSISRLRMRLFDPDGYGFAYFGAEDIRYDVLIDTIEKVEIVSTVSSPWDPGNSSLLLIEGKEFPDLNGYYLRLPGPISKAYGERLDAETTIEVVWYVNIITYIIYHERNHVLQINVTLEKAVKSLDSSDIAGHIRFDRHVYTYVKGKGKAREKIHYVPLPVSLQANVIPRSIPKKVRLGPKLIELFKPQQTRT